MIGVLFTFLLLVIVGNYVPFYFVFYYICHALNVECDFTKKF